MPVYLQPADGERVLLDTSKAVLKYEHLDLNLTSAVLSLYEVSWAVMDGTMGDEEECRVLIFRDPFTGLEIQVPLVDPRPIGKALLDGTKSMNGRSKFRGLRRS